MQTTRAIKWWPTGGFAPVIALESNKLSGKAFFYAFIFFLPSMDQNLGYSTKWCESETATENRASCQVWLRFLGGTLWNRIAHVCSKLPYVQIQTRYIHAVFFIRDTVKFRQYLSLNYSINLPYGWPLFVPYFFGNFTWFVSL